MVAENVPPVAMVNAPVLVESPIRNSCATAPGAAICAVPALLMCTNVVFAGTPAVQLVAENQSPVVPFHDVVSTAKIRAAKTAITNPNQMCERILSSLGTADRLTRQLFLNDCLFGMRRQGEMMQELS